MNPSIKDDLNISPKEFSILKDIVKKLPHDGTKASLEHATICYEEVLSERGIDVRGDRTYFSALLRLSHYEGPSWREKLLNAASKIEAEFKTKRDTDHKTHVRVRSSASIPLRPHQRDTSNRSVIQQKLDRGVHVLARSHQPPRPLPVPVHDQEREIVPVLTEEAKYSLVSRFKLWQRSQSGKQSERLFAKWYNKACHLRELHRQQLEYAIQEDHRTLKNQAFEIWFRSYHANVQFYEMQARKADLFNLHCYYRKWENLVIERRQGQYLAKLQAEREALSRALRLKNHKKLAARCLKNWRCALIRIDHLQSQALVVQNDRTKVAVWKRWVLKYCECSATKDYHTGLMRRTLQTWIRQMHKISELSTKADDKREQDLLANAFDVWKVGYAARDAANLKAVRVDHRKLGKYSFSKWRHAFGLARRHDIIQAHVDERLQKNVLLRWLDNLRNRQQLGELAETKRLAVLFRAWRTESQASAYRYASEQRADRKLLENVLHMWRLGGRGRLFAETVRDRSLRTYFSSWRSTAAVFCARLQSAEEETLLLVEARSTRQVVHNWLARLHAVDELAHKADTIYTTTITSSALARLKEVVADLQFQMLRAKRIETKTSNKRFFRAWQIALEHKRERCRQDKLEEFLEHKENELLIAVLHKWHEKTQGYVDLGGQADAMRKVRDDVQLRYFYTAWCDRHMDLFEMQSQAYDLERQNTATFLYTALLDKFHTRRVTVQVANGIWNQKVANEARTILHNWRAKCRENQRKIARAKSISRSFVLERFFGLWHDAFRAKRLHGVDQSETYVGDDSSSGSIDASRTRVPWSDNSRTLVSRSQRSQRSLFPP